VSPNDGASAVSNDCEFVVLGLPVFFYEVSTPVLIFTHVKSILSFVDIPIIGLVQPATNIFVSFFEVGSNNKLKAPQ